MKSPWLYMRLTTSSLHYFDNTRRFGEPDIILTIYKHMTPKVSQARAGTRRERKKKLAQPVILRITLAISLIPDRSECMSADVPAPRILSTFDRYLPIQEIRVGLIILCRIFMHHSRNEFRWFPGEVECAINPGQPYRNTTAICQGYLLSIFDTSWSTLNTLVPT